MDYRVQDHRKGTRFYDGGSRYVELNIDLIEDNLEDDEVYYLTIEPSTLPNRLVIGHPSNCTIVIENADGKHYIM